MSLKCTVISLVPFRIYEEKPGLVPPRFELKASDMKTPECLPIANASHFVYLDQDRGSLRVPDTADEVARAVVEDYITSQLGVSDDAKPALWWMPDEYTALDIKAKFGKIMMDNLALQKNWMLNVARIADNDWNRYHQHNVVSDFQRQCASHIGWKPEEHEWMNQPITDTDKCPACHSPVPRGAAICPVCKLVVNEEALKGLRFANA